MVKNRKPMFVSEAAHSVLTERAKENRRFIGDEVDIILGLKTPEQAKEENKLYFKDVIINNQ